MNFYKEKTFIMAVLFLAVFSVFLFYNNAVAQECDVNGIVFTPSSGEIDGDTWFNRGSPPTFKITIVGNEKCNGYTLKDVSLTNKAGFPNTDMGALNDQPVTFNPGSNKIELTFQAGEEGCNSTPDPLGFADDCHLEIQLTDSIGTFWSSKISGNHGILEYDCDRRKSTFCDGDYKFERLSITGGKVGTPTVENSICAYIAPDNKYACINGSNQMAAQNRCAEVQGCQGKNCSVINPSFCGQDSGGGGPQPPGPGKEVSFTFNLSNPVKAESLTDLAKAIGRFLFQIAIPIAVIMIIYAGLLFLTSQGNPKRIEQAKHALLYAVIGLAVILIGQGFVTLVKSILDLGK